MTVTPFPDTHADREQEPTAQARAYTWWKRFGGEHGWLGRRLHDIRMAPTYGWRLTAGWIKTVIVIAGCVLLYGFGTTVIDAARALPWSTPTGGDHTGLLATIDQPIRAYLTTHTRALPITAATAYSTWQVVGVVAFLLGYLRITPARLTWTAWGAATVTMVWIGTPEPGRQVAAGIALLAWTALSVLALRGISFTRPVFVDVNVDVPAPEVHAEIHLPPQLSPYKPYDPNPTQQPPSLN
ncbi:hypothetical protein OG819_55285 [Streptomyces sp. NBC_01549]|uniref:hypothetical protein n=1 Tax=Streptomyces sp. NBC_01549 TaxID=2975874 RepID=UPI00224CA85E|nr:hypothetical protein [Streptomyces sp. NBC_01549]MCX4598323.1 hypothetical protein [Streptomyces sp. NBC_01549]